MLEPGQSLLHYRLIEKIGEGGMGVVWKALDTNLDREVAIKILPEALSADAERMARFEREAKLLGSLNHPNIATVYGLHEAEGIRFIAMEFVPGEDLSQRLTKGGLPLDEAKEIAGQIASALEAAHERGVIHRDLKPANVRISDDGMVKVLDFGLAKTFGGDPQASYDPDLSPTVTSDRTRDGVILGTAAYMSPEQARGRAVDRRCDVWAFGCMLYECLTCAKAFPGETITDTLAAILKSEPDWTALPTGTPASLRRLLRRCLAKDPRQRLSSLGDARLEIEDAEEDAVAHAVSSRWSPWLVLPVVAALLIVALAIFFAGRDPRTPEQTISYRKLTHQRGMVRSARISPDGQTLIYSAGWEGKPLQQYMQRLDSSGALPVPLEPGHARLLSISSRGELAILLPLQPGLTLLPSFRSGTLARIPLTGGTPRAVSENVRSADWAPSGEDFALVRGLETGRLLEYPAGNVLYRNAGEIACVRVSPSGELIALFDLPFANNNRGAVAVVSSEGKYEALTPELENLTGLAWSPDGSEIWFSGADDTGPALFAVDLSGRLRVIRRSASHIMLFDIARDGRVLLGHYLFQLGTVALAPGEELERELSYTDASFVTDISADGEYILFERQDQMRYDIWLRRTDGSPPTRLGSGSSFSLSPDGNWVLAGEFSRSAPLTMLPTGAGSPRVLQSAAGALWADWSPDGKSVLWVAADAEGTTMLYIQDIDSTESRLVSTEGIQAYIDRPFYVSPDGSWIAALDRSDMVRLFPLDGGEPREVPGVLPGDEPAGWSLDGGALFVSQTTSLPAQLFRLDLENGERSLLHEVMPADPSGVAGVLTLISTPDGEMYAYSYVRYLGSLYLVTGLE
jgi:serine/threonine protein kinase/Tol biopolymer transport system component